MAKTPSGVLSYKLWPSAPPIGSRLAADHERSDPPLRRKARAIRRSSRRARQAQLEIARQGSPPEVASACAEVVCDILEAADSALVGHHALRKRLHEQQAIAFALANRLREQTDQMSVLLRQIRQQSDELCALTRKGPAAPETKEHLAKVAAQLAGRNPTEQVKIELDGVTVFDGELWRYPDFVQRGERAYKELAP